MCIKLKQTIIMSILHNNMHGLSQHVYILHEHENVIVFMTGHISSPSEPTGMENWCNFSAMVYNPFEMGTIWYKCWNQIKMALKE